MKVILQQENPPGGRMPLSGTYCPVPNMAGYVFLSHSPESLRKFPPFKDF